MEADFPGLKAWRLRKGIPLEAISQSTKLSMRQLEAIESGDFKKLPGGIYVISYIRQYARAIDFDEGELLEWYRAATVAAEAPDEQPAKPASTRFLGPLVQN